MWRNNRGYLEERIIMPDTGLEKIVSVKIKGTGIRAEQDAVRRLQHKIDHIADKQIKLSDAIETFLKESEKSLKASTVRKYRFELKSFYDIVGDSYMGKLTAGYIHKKLVDSGKDNRTLNGYIKIFKTFWLWAYRCDIVRSREVSDKLARFQDTPEKERIQDKYLEPDELKKLLEGMHEERWKRLTELLVLSGMRIGEVCALESTDVWGKVIRVTKTYDHNNHIVTPPKSFDSKREIYIQAELRECIDNINEYVSNLRIIFNFSNNLFFPDVDGGYLPYPTYSKYIREVSERVLNRRITPHTLRHTHASMLAAKGMSLEAISARLGHSDSRITKEIYLHRMEELKEKENKQLDKIRLMG